MFYSCLRSHFAALSIGAVILVGSMVSPSHATEPTRVQDQQGRPVYQLRIYEIFERNKSAFHARFRDHAARIMRRYDFKIVAMWEASREGRTEFVYLLQWPDEATMKRQWERFMADKEWSDIKEKTAADTVSLLAKYRAA